MPLELEFRAEKRRMPAQECESLPLEQMLGALLAVELLQRRLVIEQIELRRRAHHVQEDHALGPRRVVGRRAAFFAEEAAQGERAEAHRGALQDGAAGDEQFWILD